MNKLTDGNKIVKYIPMRSNKTETNLWVQQFGVFYNKLFANENRKYCTEGKKLIFC